MEDTVKTDSKKIIKTAGKGALIAGSLALIGCKVTIVLRKNNTDFDNFAEYFYIKIH